MLSMGFSRGLRQEGMSYLAYTTRRAESAIPMRSESYRRLYALVSEFPYKAMSVRT